jgi:hypothetical protein
MDVAANHPLSATTFKPPIGAPLPGAWVKIVLIFSPAKSVCLTCDAESFSKIFFCSGVAGA